VQDIRSCRVVRSANAGVRWFAIQDATQFDCHALPARQRNRHVGHEARDIARELAIGGIALRQLLGMSEVGTPDRILSGLDCAAPMMGSAWGRGGSLGPCLRTLAPSDPKVRTALVAAMDGRTRVLANDTARLARRRLGFNAETPQFTSEAFPPLLEIFGTRRQPPSGIPDRTDGHMDVRMIGIVVAGHQPVVLATEGV